MIIPLFNLKEKSLIYHHEIHRAMTDFYPLTARGHPAPIRSPLTRSLFEPIAIFSPSKFYLRVEDLLCHLRGKDIECDDPRQRKKK
jgi:hypothetical protein